MTSKAEYIQTVCELVGSNIARVIDARDGWPGIIELTLSTGPKRFSLHVSLIHSMARKEYEYRFQNPGQNRPVMTLPGTEPLLIGVWLEPGAPSVLVAAQPEVRLGDMTRFSVLFPERLFREAQTFGWAEPYRNKHAQWLWSFLPPLLPTFVELSEADVQVDSKEIQIAVVGSGLVDQPEEASGVRARQATTRLVRAARFGRDVVKVYDGRCAMCGLNLGLVSGAHILPASAPGSVDQLLNGVCLCENHHRAFDTHRIWVHPKSRLLTIHPHVVEHSKTDQRSLNFVETTFKKLAPPTDATKSPAEKMFVERYAYYDNDYRWL